MTWEADWPDLWPQSNRWTAELQLLWKNSWAKPHNVEVNNILLESIKEKVFQEQSKKSIYKFPDSFETEEHETNNFAASEFFNVLLNIHPGFPNFNKIALSVKNCARYIVSENSSKNNSLTVAYSTR